MAITDNPGDLTDAVMADAVSTAAGQLVELSRWIDESPRNAGRDPEALDWIRVAKVGEEAGEAISALNAATGANPRKGMCGSMTAVSKELLDVAVTALAAFEHLNGHAGYSLAALFGHIENVYRRAGLGDHPTTTP